MMGVSYGGVTSALVLYAIVGIFGFYTYGDDIETNFLKSLNADRIGTFFLN